jgi:thiol-disulfide isomerase/thioredoxin
MVGVSRSRTSSLGWVGPLLLLASTPAEPAVAAPPSAATLELKSYSSLPKLYAPSERVWPARQLEAGKAVVLSFMASWCEPCIAELPELEALAREPGVEVWLVVLADERPDGAKDCAVPAKLGKILPATHSLAGRALVDRCANFYAKLTQSPDAELPLNVLYGADLRPLKVLRGRQPGKTLSEALAPELARARKR